jgi:hypothetical protein
MQHRITSRFVPVALVSAEAMTFVSTTMRCGSMRK